MAQATHELSPPWLPTGTAHGVRSTAAGVGIPAMRGRCAGRAPMWRGGLTPNPWPAEVEGRAAAVAVAGPTRPTVAASNTATSGTRFIVVLSARRVSHGSASAQNDSK